MIFLTSITAIDPVSGDLMDWAGPRIKADSLEEAMEYCQKNGLGYCKIIGRLVGETILKHRTNLN